MPELPEVETVRAGLARLLPGKTIATITHDWQKSFPNASIDVENFALNASVAKVARRAKVLLIELSSKHTLMIHLKMTGQLVFVSSTIQKAQQRRKAAEIGKNVGKSAGAEDTPPVPPERFGAGHPNGSLVARLPDKSTRVIITFTDGSNLYFNDQRKFGWMRLVPTAEVSQIDFFKKVGPEPLADDFTAKEFIVRLRRRNKSYIKSVLLDQTVVAGIGNIYADESLWAAKIHPLSRVQDVHDTQLKKLFAGMQEVLRLSIQKGGSTDKNYVDAEGKRGSYLTFAKVFRREGKPCERCGTTILKMRVAGRGTHICPDCQVV